jgi:hypothetical protein
MPSRVVARAVVRSVARANARANAVSGITVRAVRGAPSIHSAH